MEELRQLVGRRRIILNGCCAVLVNAKQEVLLQQCNEPQQRWGLPGGLMELGETAKATVVREVAEESGISLAASQLTLLNVYADGKQRLAANGDVFDIITIAFYAEGVSGQPQIKNAESLQYRWVKLSQLPAPIVAGHRQALADYLALKKTHR